MPFGNFWMGFQSVVKPVVTVPAWERGPGYLGWSFDILTVDYEHVQVYTPMPHPRKIFVAREAVFRRVYDLWDSYISSSSADEQLTLIRRSVYAISMMHWYEKTFKPME
jgi:hypothetical protein